MYEKRYLYWPIRFIWRKPHRLGFKWYDRRVWFTTHGWQVGWDGFGKGVFGWTLSIGPLKICFGSKEFKVKGGV